MTEPSHQPAVAAAHSHDQDGKDDSWVSYSDMDKSNFSAMLTAFSLSTSFISHPLTVLTVRQQAPSALIAEAAKMRNLGVVAAMQSAMGTVGLRGLFRGWLPTAASGIPSDVLYFSSMEHTREAVQPSLKAHMPAVLVDFGQAASSSVIASFVARIPYVPAEVISTRLIVQSRSGLGALAMSRLVYAESGIRGFYKGFLSSYISGVVSCTMWWWTYSTCRRYTASHFGGQYPVVSDALAGFLSGFSATLFSHPFETIKTRMMSAANSQQVPKPSFSGELASVVRRNGLLGLYRGLPASLYQTALGSAFFAASYEFIKTSSSNSSNSSVHNICLS